MKSLNALIAASAVFLMLASPVHAGGGYFAIEGSALSLSSDSSDDLNPGGLRLRLGTQIHPFMDIEGHYGFSFDDDNDVYDELSASYFGVYLKGYLPVGGNSALFALGGFSNVKLNQTVGISELSESRADVSFGFGLETKLTENADLTADYMSYMRDEGLFESISSFNFGIKLYF